MAAVKPLDFGEYIFGLGFLFKVCQVAVPNVRDAQFVLNGIEHFQNPSQLMVGQHTNAQIQVGAPLGFCAQAVLADEHEG